MKICLWTACTLLALLTTEMAAAQPCELSGVRTLGPLVVHAPEIVAIELLVYNADVIVRPTESERHAVEVRAGLAFDAVSQSIDYRLTGRVQTGHGMVSLSLEAAGTWST